MTRPTLRILTIAAVLAALLYPRAVPEEARLLPLLADASHFPLFFLLVRGIGGWRRANVATTALRGWAWAGGVFCAALLVEGLQKFTGRDPSWRDLFASVGGGLAAVWWPDRARLPGAARRALYTLFAGWLAAVLWPAAEVLGDRWIAAREFPLLASFESRRELDRWDPNGLQLERERMHATHGRWALKVTPGAAFKKYPGVFLTDCLGDWRTCSTLVLDVFLEADGPRRMWFRADDSREQPVYEERAEFEVMLEPGPATVEVPLREFLRTLKGRPLARDRITRAGVFFETTESIDVVWIDHVRLLPGPVSD